MKWNRGALAGLVVLTLLPGAATCKERKEDASKILRELGPGKKLGIALVNLYGANAYENKMRRQQMRDAVLAGLGAVGAFMQAQASRQIAHDPALRGNPALMREALRTSPLPSTPEPRTPEEKEAAEGAKYAQDMAEEFLRIYDEALSRAGAFGFCPSGALVGTKDGQPMTMSQVAAENGLFASVEAKTVLGMGVGFKKRLKATTDWRLTGPSGWELEIKTEALSEEALSVFPDPSNPKLRPVVIRLARDGAELFLEQLGQRMKAAGCAAEMKEADPEEVAADSLPNPGARPRPEPDSELNSDGKWEKRLALPGGTELALVYIPGGDFVMGSPEWSDDEESHPPHPVTIGWPFWLGKLEVTQAQWKAVMGANPSKFKGDDLPVEGVTWNDCGKFLDALNRLLGLDPARTLRLPTEAQWEYASRAGSKANYSFSDSMKNLPRYAWFEGTANKASHPCGTLLPNPWGLYDMYGNVAEWCADPWHDDYKGAPADGAAWEGKDEDRVCRGGSWDSAFSGVRSHSRDRNEATQGSETVGFRVVMPVSDSSPASVQAAGPEPGAETGSH